MNAERLHAIAIALRTDLATTEAASLVQTLADELNATVTEPQNPAHVQAVGTIRGQLDAALASSRTNEFSDAWWLALKELGVADYFGEPLRRRIEEIFLRNEITPPIAAAELAEIAAQLSRITTTLDSLISGFRGVNIGAEGLAPGEFEVGFLIPRQAVDNELEQLGKEFVKLDQILGPFMELTGENRPDLEVRSISSSGFQVFLAAYPELALTVSRIVESLLSSYERIRGMRKTVEELEAKDVPQEVIEPLIQHANDRMKLDVDELARTLVEEAADRIPEDRSYELKVNVTHSLRELADRIDEGYSIEVRSFVLPEGEELPEGATEELVNVARQITARQPRMRTMNLTGRPILELSEGEEEGQPEGDGEPHEPPVEGE